MNGSIKIGTAFGIPVRIHWTFLLVVYAFALTLDAPFGIIVLGMIGLFGSVLLHELGHSLVAKSFGIRVIDITFWPLGGMARMSEIPESPRIEGLVAIAGPLVNLALALLGAVGMVASSALGFEAGYYAGGWFTFINLLMGTFNLIPAFPMDGGRILRAWFGRTSDWVTATEQAVAVGRVFAGIMFVGSLAVLTVQPALCAMPLIAVFVWIAGGRELLAVRIRHGVGPFGDLGARVFDASYAPPEAHEGGGPESAQRPAGWSGPRKGGFSEEAVRELERFRGRLQRGPDDEPR